MRIAVLSDVHGNVTALEAVIEDLETLGADLVVNGGDLVGGGPRPAEIIDRVVDLGWPSVVGNTDEVHWNARPLEEHARKNPALASLWQTVFDDVARTRELIGDRRVEWLKTLPMQWYGSDVSVIHAAPGDTWIAPPPSATDSELERVYGSLASRIVVYGHLHVPFIRQLASTIVANSGSVGMPYDGDPRASYLLVDEGQPTIRRVEYDIDREASELMSRGHPQAAWRGKILRAGKFLPPE